MWRTAARRRRSQNVLQVMVFSVTIMSLLILTLLRTDLIDEWQAQLPENTPNHFMMNITRNQIGDIENFFHEITFVPFKMPSQSLLRFSPAAIQIQSIYNISCAML